MYTHWQTWIQSMINIYIYIYIPFIKISITYTLVQLNKYLSFSSSTWYSIHYKLKRLTQSYLQPGTKSEDWPIQLSNILLNLNILPAPLPTIHYSVANVIHMQSMHFLCCILGQEVTWVRVHTCTYTKLQHDHNTLFHRQIDTRWLCV